MAADPQMLEWKDVVAAVVTLVASFAGAWAAFRFEARRRKAEEDERRIGAANRAIYVLYHYWNILNQFRKEALEPFRGRPDAWLNLPAHPAIPVATDRFQANDLQFLLQAERADTYVTLMLEEQRFLLALSLIASRSGIVLSEVFPKMAAAGFAVGRPVDSQHLEQVLGVDVTHKLKMLAASLYRNVDEDLTSLRAAHDKLRDAMTSLYPDKQFLKVVFEDTSVAA